MIRWSYVVPRLVVLAIVLLGIAFGLDPLLRWSMVTSLQAMVGAKVDVKSLRTSLRDAHVTISRLEIANPRSTEKNLVEAAYVALDLDGRALLRRQFVVRNGYITGLKFSSQRSTDGKLPESEKAKTECDKKFQETALAWLERLGDLLNANVAYEFESVQVAHELAERWPKEYETLRIQAGNLKAHVYSMRDAVEQARHRPLENLDKVSRAISEVSVLRQDIQSMHRRLTELHQKMMRDKDNIEYARRRDIGRIQEALRLESLKADSLSEYVLGPDVAPYFQSVVTWTAWGKKCLDIAGDPPRPERWRGEVIEFPRLSKTPDLLIERITVAGEARMDLLPVAFRGVLTNVSSNPKQLGKPSQLDVQLAGKHPAHLQVVMDQTTDVPLSQVTFDCPVIHLGQRSVGNPESLVIDMDQAKVHLWAQLKLTGDQLDGRIEWIQDSAGMKPTVATKYGGERVAARLRTALAQVDGVHAVLKVSGPVTKPQWQIETKVGEQLASGLNLAARDELAAQRDALEARLNLEITAQLTKLESKLADEKQQISSYLQVGDQLLSELHQVAGSITSKLPPEVMNHPLMQKAAAASANIPLPKNLKQFETILR